jgi:hypothetical protein
VPSRSWTSRLEWSWRHVANDPIDVAFSRDGSTAHVVDNDASLVGEIDAATGTASHLEGSTAASRAIGLTATGSAAYVADEVSPVMLAYPGHDEPLHVQLDACASRKKMSAQSPGRAGISGSGVPGMSYSRPERYAHTMCVCVDIMHT